MVLPEKDRPTQMIVEIAEEHHQNYGNRLARTGPLSRNNFPLRELAARSPTRPAEERSLVAIIFVALGDSSWMIWAISCEVSTYQELLFKIEGQRERSCGIFLSK
jgi:hypothetical protein